MLAVGIMLLPFRLEGSFDRSIYGRFALRFCEGVVDVDTSTVDLRPHPHYCFFNQSLYYSSALQCNKKRVWNYIDHSKT